jgi:peptidoglycan/LPS O-acetylase OafA/YrhL
MTRIVLALIVVVSHSFPLGGFGPDPWEEATGTDNLGHMAVCGFFLLSGWLVASSAARSSTRSYLMKRARRLLPGFWMALAVVAVASTLLDPSRARDAVSYVVSDLALIIRQPDIANMTAGLPSPGFINSSLWTLQWEAICYLGILLLLRHRLALPVGLAVLWGVAIGHQNLVFALLALFTLGAYLRDRPPRPSHLAGAAAAILVLVSGRLGLYWIIGLPALAVVIYWAAEHLPARSPDSDPSYGIYIYAYPIQQGLVAAGLATFGFAAYAGASVGLAVVAGLLSWRLVERPFLRRATPSVGPDPVALPERPPIGLVPEATV